MTQSSWKRDTESKSHPGVKLAPVRVFSCKHPQSQDIPGQKLVQVFIFFLLMFYRKIW